MQCEQVNYVSTTKFLGIIIDNMRKFNNYIIYFKSKISKSISIFCKMRQFSSVQRLKVYRPTTICLSVNHVLL